MNEENTIKLYWRESLAVREALMGKKFTRQIIELTGEVWKTYKKGATVYTCGNGGGAGLVANLVADWGFHPFVSDDKSETFNIPRLKVCSLCADSSMLTAAANDHGYQNVFVEQIRDIMSRDDLIIAFSGSGNSQNVLSAFEYANSLGAYTACVSRGDGGKASAIAKTNIVIPGTSRFPGQIGKNDNNLHAEDAFVSITHLITGLLRQRVREAHKKIKL
jgi:D-sedoheptulose 7-phosphate isomerase